MSGLIAGILKDDASTSMKPRAEKIPVEVDGSIAGAVPQSSAYIRKVKASAVNVDVATLHAASESDTANVDSAEITVPSRSLAHCLVHLIRVADRGVPYHAVISKCSPGENLPKFSMSQRKRCFLLKCLKQPAVYMAELLAAARGGFIGIRTILEEMEKEVYSIDGRWVIKIYGQNCDQRSAFEVSWMDEWGRLVDEKIGDVRPFFDGPLDESSRTEDDTFRAAILHPAGRGLCRYSTFNNTNRPTTS
ncbi:hypothetical protein BDQ12DRAFT_725688 [Crucibulum laeve]|uniref:Uncharacterized protein n=1 Tax=Crucibulum laeve TaxID=68775 RepID=A0A5C3LVC8_9AGAR|nr:hypothetical protein BDQ12DRAFT_725688 [Crucibulum laeve]